jgi:hypothetical protein
MRVFVMAVVGLMVAAGAQAQVQRGAVIQVPKGGVVVGSPSRVFVPGGGCPGVLSARRQSPGGTMWTVSREDSASGEAKAKRAGEGVHVELKSADGVLRELELSVSYIAPGARVMTVGAPDKKDLRQKTFKLSADEQTDVIGDLLVGPAFEITRVHLTSATFADGHVWHALSENFCSVEPSRFMPVGAK